MWKRDIDAHGLKIQGRYQKFLPKSLGGQGFQEKLPGEFPILGLITFLLTNVLKFAWGVLYLPSPLTPRHPLLRVHL